jgi:hypothetical protein
LYYACSSRKGRTKEWKQSGRRASNPAGP